MLDASNYELPATDYGNGIGSTSSIMTSSMMNPFEFYLVLVDGYMRNQHSFNGGVVQDQDVVKRNLCIILDYHHDY